MPWLRQRHAAQRFITWLPRVRNVADSAATWRSMRIYEDEHVVALNKWRGYHVQDSHSSSHTLLANLDVFRDPEENRTPRLAHRLDTNTTGVLLIGKDYNVTRRLNRLFELRAITKTYHAVLVGVPSRPSGVILGTDDESESNAETEYRVLSKSSDSDVCLVELRPRTGYKHQLRKQAAVQLGCPILGDKRFGGGQDAVNPKIVSKLVANGLRTDQHPHGLVMHLHSSALIIPGYHFVTGYDLKISAPLPPHFQLTLGTFGLTGVPETPVAAFVADDYRQLKHVNKD